MNKNESKYFNTALLMDEALLRLLEKKEYEFITVKEVCKTAGVNRSTFYLHYETIDDLLKESVEMINKRFVGKFDAENIFIADVQNASKHDSILITPKYLKPYLEFVKENKRALRLICSKGLLFQTENTLNKMYKALFSPILDKFGIAEDDKPYVFDFYFKGVVAIVMRWVSLDCKKDENEVIRLIENCVPADLIKEEA